MPPAGKVFEKSRPRGEPNAETLVVDLLVVLGITHPLA